jgi:hypothetical protein
MPHKKHHKEKYRLYWPKNLHYRAVSPEGIGTLGTLFSFAFAVIG